MSEYRRVTPQETFRRIGTKVEAFGTQKANGSFQLEKIGVGTIVYWPNIPIERQQLELRIPPNDVIYSDQGPIRLIVGKNRGNLTPMYDFGTDNTSTRRIVPPHTKKMAVRYFLTQMLIATDLYQY